MATKSVVVDDLSQNIVDEDKARTDIYLAFEGRAVVLDLADENYAALSQALAPFLDAGREPEDEPVASASQPVRASQPAQSVRPPQPRQSTTLTDAKGMQHIRLWARENGFTVSERGRIPYSVMDAYTKAHLRQPAGRR